MTIKLYAATGPNLSDYDQAPPDVSDAVKASLTAIENALPGTAHLLTLAGYEIFYDPQNAHGVLGKYSGTLIWPGSRVYLSEKGIKRSTCHELGHALDVAAMPSEEIIARKFGVDAAETLMITHSLYHWYASPRAKRKTSQNFTQTLLQEAILNARICRNEPIARLVALHRIETSQVDNKKQNDFLYEITARLFEAFIWMKNDKKSVMGLPRQRYFLSDVFWDDEWLSANKDRIRRFFQIKLDAIFQVLFDEA